MRRVCGPRGEPGEGFFAACPQCLRGGYETVWQVRGWLRRLVVAATGGWRLRNAGGGGQGCRWRGRN